VKTGITAVSRWGVVLASVFAPFLVVLSVLLTHHGVGIYLEANMRDALSWVWLVLCAEMMVGIYFLAAYLISHAFKHQTARF
jgi:hypothetical protein